MFDKLMSMLRRDGAVTIDQMARELGTSPEVVNGMIEHMTRVGWLQRMNANCDLTCRECVFVRDCARAGQSQVWHLTS
jgi:Mn-dependent DtxR family transcriptional regulator